MSRFLTIGAMLAALAACEALPHDGPSIQTVRKDATQPGALYSLVELDARASAVVAATPDPQLASLAPVSSAARVDLIGVGDGLTVTVYERGAGALFGSAQSILASGGDRPTAAVIPPLLVDRAGDVVLPYGGRMHVAGLTTAQAARVVEASLKGRAVQPQAVVTISQNVSNSVSVLGEVRSPGRYPLSDASDRLMDVIALAAGPTKPAADIRVEVSRGPATATIVLADLLRDDSDNVRLAPRDQVRLVYQPRKFSTFGALARTAQYPIEDEQLTLANALGKAGGLDANTADARSVLLFRFERPEVARALGVTAAPSPKGVPIIYHLDLRRPEGLFVAGQFQVRTDDLIYVPRASLTEAKQFIDVVSSASQVAYNARVSSVLP